MTESQKYILSQIKEGKPINPCSPVVTNLDELPLSTGARLKLCALPDDAILYAIEAWKKVPMVEDPVRYIFKVAHAWCKERNIKPDWDWSFSLLEAYGIDKDCPLLMSSDGKLPFKPLPDPDSQPDYSDAYEDDNAIARVSALNTSRPISNALPISPFKVVDKENKQMQAAPNYPASYNPYNFECKAHLHPLSCRYFCWDINQWDREKNSHTGILGPSVRMPGCLCNHCRRPGLN